MHEKKQLVLCGVGFRQLSANVRTELVWPQRMQHQVLSDLTSQAWCEEAMLLLTCYRSEIIAVVHDTDKWRAWQRMRSDFFQTADLWYHKTQQNAFLHMVKTCSGLDSRIVGETQIFGQMKAAYDQARRAGFAKKCLGFACAQLWHATKKVRYRTQLGRYQKTLSERVVEAVERLTPNLKTPQIACIGAGRIMKSLVPLLVKIGFQSFTLLCRDERKAQEVLALSRRIQWKPMHALQSVLASSDVVISATSAQSIVVEYSALSPPPAVMIDLAMPIDIDPRWRQGNTTLLNIDQLVSSCALVASERQDVMLEAHKEAARLSCEGFRLWEDYSQRRWESVAAFCKEVDKAMASVACPWLEEKCCATHKGAVQDFFLGVRQRAERLIGEVEEILDKHVSQSVLDKMNRIEWDMEALSLEKWVGVAKEKKLSHHEVAQLFQTHLRRWMRRCMHPVICRLRQYQQKPCTKKNLPEGA